MRGDMSCNKHLNLPQQTTRSVSLYTKQPIFQLDKPKHRAVPGEITQIIGLLIWAYTVLNMGHHWYSG